MSTGEIVFIIGALACAVAATVIGVALYATRLRPDAPEVPLPAPPRMVVVNTQKPDDQSLRGQMVDDGQQSGWVVLRAPSLHVAGGEGTASWEKLPADVSIALSHVAWIIEVPADADTVI